MYKQLFTILPFAALVMAPAAAQVSYGDRSGYVPPRTERPAPAQRPETLAPRSAESQTRTRGTVLDIPDASQRDEEQVIFYESTETVPPPSRRMSEADLPQQGTTQAAVRARFGDPVRSFPAVGDPPITRWDYQNFRVFFEYNLVLHAVIPGAFPPISNRDELVSGR
ncbi:MAG: hypothetical protein CMN28_04580 [Salinisphaeraceae bacterium]|jgi:hypothetical protein|nr:hypothetical protein [Salinisphaeraceae bacterium]